MIYRLPPVEDAIDQGDIIDGCPIPYIDTYDLDHPSQMVVAGSPMRVIVLTQTCDLANEKIQLAALCPIADLATWEQLNPDYAKRGFWESVRQGRREGLHMLSSFGNAGEGRNALVADFRQIFSLPLAYLRKHATGLGSRWRLQSPYREHFSQAFARFFMRVGLPTAIPAFK